MGLDTSHNCWHGPYSSFNAFRYALAAQIGINLDEYIGYGNCSLENPEKQRKATKDLNSIEHDIQPLLNHSDCEGKLSVKEARRIAKGLNNILENFKDNQAETDKMVYNFKEKIIQFRDGCLDAVNKKQQIKFC